MQFARGAVAPRRRPASATRCNRSCCPARARPWHNLCGFPGADTFTSAFHSTHQPILKTMAKLSNLSDLLVLELQDLYSAENQLVKALPKMAKAATNDELQSGFNEHLEQTKQHVERLERVMEILGASPKGKTCKAMQGLIAEGEEILEEDAEPAVRDAALIAAAQKVEHYEIAGYGSARTYAELLAQDEVAELLQETLEEEGETDKRLSEIAETINEEADTEAEET